MENKVKEMKKLLTETIETNKSKINNLEKKVLDMGTKFDNDNHEDIKKKMKALESVTKQQQKNTETTSERVHKLELI